MLKKFYTFFVLIQLIWSCDRNLVENYQPVEYKESQALKDAEVCYFQGTLLKESLNKLIFNMLNGGNLNLIAKAFMQITLEYQIMRDECKDVTLENFEQFIRKHSSSKQNACLDQLEDISRKIIDIINIQDTPIVVIFEDIKKLLFYVKNFKSLCRFSEWEIKF